MDFKKIERVTRSLAEGDVAFLCGRVHYCGGYTGDRFKGRLIGAVQTGYDHARQSRLAPVVKSLTEEEILWLCENHDAPDSRRK